MEVSGFCEEQNPMIYHGSMSNYYDIRACVVSNRACCLNLGGRKGRGLRGRGSLNINCFL